MENKKEHNSNLENKLDTLLANAKSSNLHNSSTQENSTVAVEEPEEKRKCSGNCKCTCGDKE